MNGALFRSPRVFQHLRYSLLSHRQRFAIHDSSNRTSFPCFRNNHKIGFRESDRNRDIWLIFWDSFISTKCGTHRAMRSERLVVLKGDSEMAKIVKLIVCFIRTLYLHKNFSNLLPMRHFHIVCIMISFISLKLFLSYFFVRLMLYGIRLLQITQNQSDFYFMWLYIWHDLANELWMNES